MKQHDFMSHELKLPELTIRGMILGLLITIVFTASNVYLGLKVGLTFSSAIRLQLFPWLFCACSRIPIFWKTTLYRRRRRQQVRFLL